LPASSQYGSIFVQRQSFICQYLLWLSPFGLSSGWTLAYLAQSYNNPVIYVADDGRSHCIYPQRLIHFSKPVCAGVPEAVPRIRQPPLSLCSQSRCTPYGTCVSNAVSKVDRSKTAHTCITLCHIHHPHIGRASRTSHRRYLQKSYQ
jgi:hypothetical protein